MTDPRFEVPTWNKTYTMLMNQADKIRCSGFKPDVIVGVSRGGWVPARILSDLLENPNLANVRVEFYSGKAGTKEAPVLTQEVSMPVAGKRVLIVDDVADTGRSLRLVFEHVLQKGAGEVQIATLYYKPWSAVKPDYYEEQTERWIAFPWDVKETARKMLGKHGHASIEEIAAKLAEAGLPKKLATMLLKETTVEKPC